MHCLWANTFPPVCITRDCNRSYEIWQTIQKYLHKPHSVTYTYHCACTNAYTLHGIIMLIHQHKQNITNTTSPFWSRLSVYMNAPEVWVHYVRKEFAGSNRRGPHGTSEESQSHMLECSARGHHEDTNETASVEGCFHGRPRSEHIFTTSMVW